MRQAALAALTAGCSVGLAGAIFPLLDAHFTLGAETAFRWSLALLAGGLGGALVGRFLGRSSGGIRSILTASVTATVLGLAWLSTAFDVAALGLLGLLLGCGIGLASVGASYALDGVLSAGRAASALDLAAACFGFGAAGCAALTYLARRWLPFDEAAMMLAAALAIVSLGIRLKGSPPAPVGSAVLEHHWHDILRATRVLLSICMTLQAVLWGAAAYWLGFYAGRGLGVPTSLCAALVAIFWLGWTGGRTFALRSRQWGAFANALFVGFCGGLACLFLLNTVSYSGAAAGALLLGAATGWLQGLVQMTANRQHVTRAMVGRFSGGAVMASLFSGALVGGLAQSVGARGVVWFIAGTGALLCLCVMLLAVESRLADRPAEV